MLFDESNAAVFASFLIRLRFPRERIDPRFYWAFAQSEFYWEQARALMTGGAQPQFNGNALARVKIPLPPIADQQSIAADIESELRLVAASRELIHRLESKITATLGTAWGDDPNTTNQEAVPASLDQARSQRFTVEERLRSATT